MYCTVIVDSKSRGIGDGLTYETADTRIHIGSSVQVPLRNRVVEGLVVHVTEQRAQSEYDVKKVIGLLGHKPFLTEAQVKTALWMSDYYCCTLRHALRVFLPSPPWSDLLPKETVSYCIADITQPVKGAKQKQIIEYFGARDSVLKTELQSALGASADVLKRLCEKGILSETKEVERVEVPASYASAILSVPTLSSEQQAAYELIKESKKPTLLFGVTGSGKTEVYATLIADALREGKQAIVLVPEILLTEHSIRRFQELIDRDAISVVHSRLTPAQRKAEWRRIHSGQVAVVIGSRSALFAPLQNLGVVILDEEHEWTYKNEQTPRYHARETAQKLCEFSGAKLVYGSATPSLESWSRAKSTIYGLARLPNRFENRPLPQVQIVDLATSAFGDNYPFSPPLLAAIKDRLAKGEQSVLFLNRRGIATSLLCLDCRRRVVSPHSQLPFTIHRGSAGKPYLFDHTSGVRAELPPECPQCHSVRLRAVGAGTQKVEEILEKLFPSARLLRADADTMTHPEHMRRVLDMMHAGKADILLGTQTVVKGLDLPKVTLAAVLVADVGLSLPHFRASERGFQLLAQLAGRSGRAAPGEVIIQTFRPDSPEVKYAAKHATEEFLELEWKMRQHMGYPPAVEMGRFVVRGTTPESTARTLAKKLQAGAINSLNHVHAAPTFFDAGRVWHVLVRGPDARRIVAGVPLPEDVVIDMDPIDCL